MPLPLRHKLPAPSRQHRVRRHHFLAAWVRSPLKIGALLPSSRSLARAMAAEVDVKRPGMVIELGAGTGVVTHALLQAGIPPERLVVIEREEKLFGILSAHFNNVKLLQADAIKLEDALADIGVTRVSTLVSSLPLLTMPKPVRHAIQQQMAAVIGDYGVIIQFTYGPKSPISRHQMRKHHLQGKRMKLVMANVPPAHVWVYRHAK